MTVHRVYFYKRAFIDVEGDMTLSEAEEEALSMSYRVGVDGEDRYWIQEDETEKFDDFPINQPTIEGQILYHN
jgi:hypothetical protein